MGKEEFELAYCKASGITLEEYRKRKVTMPCACSDENCKGWAAIPNNPNSIEDQKMFYSPKSESVKKICKS